MWHSEAKKLLTSPAILGFFAACLLVNVFFSALVLGDSGYPAYVSSAAQTAGTRVDESFHEKLALMKEPQHTQKAWYLEALRAETEGMPNIYETFDAASIADAYSKMFKTTEETTRLLQEKYALLQASVDEKAKNGEGLDLYFAGATSSEHSALAFLWRLLTLEGALLGVLMMLFLIGYEQSNRTETLILSLRKGRRLMRTKLAAALLVGIPAFVLLWLATMALYLALHPFIVDIWNSSVSSAFHIILDETGKRPFITWDSLSLLEYAFAQLGISTALVACLTLLGFFIGIYIRKTYLAFLVALITVMMLLIVPILISRIDIFEMAAHILNHNPVRLWWNQELWFTDGTRQYLWPRFETWGSMSSLLLLALLSLIGYGRFKRKDIA
jgi:ABC-type transport system involved in multi-copper enzyme maturation permease subunit